MFQSHVSNKTVPFFTKLREHFRKGAANLLKGTNNGEQYLGCLPRLILFHHISSLFKPPASSQLLKFHLEEHFLIEILYT